MLKLERREEQQRQEKVIRQERARKDAEGPMAVIGRCEECRADVLQEMVLA